MNWFLKLDRWLQIVIVIVILLMAYGIYRWIRNKLAESDFNKAVVQSKAQLAQLAQQGIVPSYPDADYTITANTIQEALNGCGAGFDETLAPAFQKMRNDADIYKLIAAYDIRKVDKCGLFTGDFNGDLSATLTYKFSGVEDYLIDGSLSKINEILKNNGLKFTF